jgi:hypothetical protein
VSVARYLVLFGDESIRTFVAVFAQEPAHLDHLRELVFNRTARPWIAKSNELD